VNPAVFKGKHQTKAVTHILQFWVLHLTPLSQLQAMSTANKDLRIFFKINLVKEQKYFSESISIGQTKIHTMETHGSHTSAAEPSSFLGLICVN